MSLPETKASASDLQSLELSRIAFKAPAFWEVDPELWFCQVESQFVMSSITVDSTKFHAVVAALNSEVLTCVRDIIRDPPKENSYALLKDRILKYFSQSKTSRLNLLLKDLQLGDKRPSHLLYEMQNLASGQMEEDLLKTLWLQRLPTNIQQILSVCTVNLSELAQIADKILDVSGPPMAIANVVSSSSELDSLRAEIQQLQRDIKNLSRFQNQPRNVSRFRRRRSRTPSRSESRVNSPSEKLCWYHQHFQSKAKKCIDPCSWSEN